MKKIYGIISLVLIVLVGLYIYLQNRITISVIIPVYNAEKYLERCLDSIFIQSGTFEVIAVNDGSTDSSLQILKQYAKKYSNLRIIDQKNQGVSSARNAGMLIAKNKYITFVDNDDWLEPDAFATARKIIKRDKTDILLTDYYDVYDRQWIRDTRGDKMAELSPEITKYPKRDIETLSLLSPFYAKDAISDLYYYGGWVTHAFFNRKFLINNNVKFPDNMTNGEDIIFTFKLYTHNPYISVSNKAIYNYYNRVSSASKGLETLNIIRKRINYLRTLTEYKNSPRYIQMYIDDGFVGIIMVCIANLQRHGVPLSDGLPEIYKIMETMYKYSQQELKSARNYQKIKSYLQQIGLNQPL
jgi:glycosyltransferase EpsH